jgi:transcription antitermination factor NusG
VASSRGSKTAKPPTRNKGHEPARKANHGPPTHTVPPPTPGLAPSVPRPGGPWVIIQLSPTGEREKDLPTIVRAAQRGLGRPVEVFVPAISQKVRDESQTLFYMDGYVFIRFEEGVNYNKLQDTTYFGQVLTQPGPTRSKVYAMLQDKELDPMRVGMNQMKVGGFAEKDTVRIIQGNFKNLRAEVSYVHDGGEVVQVFVSMRSKKVLMDFPASYLHKIE